MGGGGLKTGSGSHNYKLLKRAGGSFANFSKETGLLLSSPSPSSGYAQSISTSLHPLVLLLPIKFLVSDNSSDSLTKLKDAKYLVKSSIYKSLLSLYLGEQRFVEFQVSNPYRGTDLKT